MEEKPEITEETFPQATALDLKAIREARGLTLKAIFETTRVGLTHLAAVENGDYHELPPPVYARNFIRKYARAIGTDEKPILDRYHQYLESLKPPDEGKEIRKPWPETNHRYRFLFLSLGGVIVAGLLVSILFLYDQAGNPPSPASSTGSAPVVPAPEPSTTVPDAPIPATVESAPTPTTVESVPVTTTAKSVPVSTTVKSTPVPAEKTIPQPAETGKKTHKLIIEAQELTWVRIMEDQNPAFQGLLNPGDRIERTADLFQLDLGNAGGVQLTFQGKPLGSPGKRGQVLHMRLPEGGADVKSP